MYIYIWKVKTKLFGIICLCLLLLLLFQYSDEWQCIISSFFKKKQTNSLKTTQKSFTVKMMKVILSENLEYLTQLA